MEHVEHAVGGASKAVWRARSASEHRDGDGVGVGGAASASRKARRSVKLERCWCSAACGSRKTSGEWRTGEDKRE